MAEGSAKHILGELVAGELHSSAGHRPQHARLESREQRRQALLSGDSGSSREGVGVLLAASGHDPRSRHIQLHQSGGGGC